MCIFHKWNKWGVPWKGIITKTSSFYGTSTTENRLIQDRTCERCGKYQWREI